MLNTHARLGLTILFLSFMLAACDRTKQYSDVEHLQKGKEYQTQGKLEAATIELKNALQKNPKNAEARLRLGEIYTSQGLGEQAELQLNMAKEAGIDLETLKIPLGEALLLRRLNQRVVDEIKPGPQSIPGDIPKIFEIQGRALLALRRFE